MALNSDFVANAKNIISGILVILSLVGAAYGSFKPESDARETYDSLAPDVDVALEQTDINMEAIHEMEARVIKLEAENQILQFLLVGYLTKQGMISQPSGGAEKAPQSKVVAPAPIPEPLEKMLTEPPPPPQQKTAPPVKRRKRAAPSWKK